MCVSVVLQNAPFAHYNPMFSCTPHYRGGHPCVLRARGRRGRRDVARRRAPTGTDSVQRTTCPNCWSTLAYFARVRKRHGGNARERTPTSRSEDGFTSIHIGEEPVANVWNPVLSTHWRLATSTPSPSRALTGRTRDSRVGSRDFVR